MADIFAKFEPLRARRAAVLAVAGDEPLGVRMGEFISPTEIMINDGRAS